MLSFRVTEALGPDQLKHGSATGLLAPDVIVLPARPPSPKRPQSILKYMVPSLSVMHFAGAR